MAIPYIAFDSVNLDDYFSTWQEQANSRINAVTVPRRHGALVTDTIVEDPRIIGITGRAQAATAEDLRDIIDELSELFTRRNKRLQLWDDRYILADKSKFGFGYVPASAMCAMDFNLEFFCPDPFWYALTPESDDFDLTTADTAIDITNNKYRRTITVTNPGAAYTYPIITVTTGLTALTTIVIRNITTGRQCQYVGTVLVGKALVINMAAFTVENDGVEDLTNFQSSDFWALAPGDNEIQIEGTAPANYDFGYTQRWI